ncbi:anthrone oxygenase family protein [Alloacidobacterium sp.]|uniref:anthrone oxygenase family protein n=1 Tax=Alloacidobacterium sp. TaxID=2951999 RepID=UPI002D726CA3|nr:anthrone oxygenase family protein [Alloacidobacterium sp.]HYK37680.1 anthrone oxygenase family protein [Alloacidobacterium sp.]
MHYFDIITILCIGLMVGTEFAVSAFINPVVWQLEETTQAKILSLFARLLGKVMPFWYALSLVLMLIETYLRRHEPALPSLLTAAGIWIAAIIFSITVLVPINNRIAALEDGWRQQNKHWDTLHRWRIFLLVAAMALLLHGILQ